MDAEQLPVSVAAAGDDGPLRERLRTLAAVRRPVRLPPAPWVATGAGGARRWRTLKKVYRVYREEGLASEASARPPPGYRGARAPIVMPQALNQLLVTRLRQRPAGATDGGSGCWQRDRRLQQRVPGGLVADTSSRCRAGGLSASWTPSLMAVRMASSEMIRSPGQRH